MERGITSKDSKSKFVGEAAPTTSPPTFWENFGKYFRDASLEMFSTGLTVIATLLIREWYAQSRLGQSTHDSAHAALSGFLRPEPSDLNQMTTEQLAKLAVASSDAFWGTNPPSNLKDGVRARNALELLLQRKNEQLTEAQRQAASADSEGDSFITKREKRRIKVLYDDIVDLLAQWQDVSDAVEELRHAEIMAVGENAGYFVDDEHVQELQEDLEEGVHAGN